MAKKEFIKVEVETFAQAAMALKDALEAMEAELVEAGYSLDDFEEEEEADAVIEPEKNDGGDRKKPRFPKLS